MDNSRKLTRITMVNFELLKLVATTNDSVTKRTGQIFRSGSMTVINHEGKKFSVQNQEVIRIGKPEFAQIEFLMRGDFVSKTIMDSDEIEDHIDELGFPLHAKATSIISVVTDHMFGIPLLISPTAPESTESIAQQKQPSS